jgi:hypothetical protein
MANGAVVRLLELPPEYSEATAGMPGTAVTEIETTIGQAVVNAVKIFYEAAIAQQETGLLPPAIIAAGGSRIAAIATLQLDYEGGDLDFVAQAHHAGKRELRRCFNNTDLFRQHDPVEIDRVFDASISDVLGIVSRVVREERFFRTN